MTKAKVDETLISFAQNLCYIALLVFVIIAAVGKLGADIGRLGQEYDDCREADNY